MPKLTDDELRAIRARDEAYAHAYKIWNSQRNPDSDFYDDTPIPHPSAPEDRAALLAHADAQDAELARLRNDLAIIEQGCNSPWMTGAAFKDRVADIFASRALLDGADTPGEGGA